MRLWPGRPTRAELIAEIEMWKRRRDGAQHEAYKAYTRAKEAEKLARRLRREAVQLRAVEPIQPRGCTKVRFHHEHDAQAWLVTLSVELGEDSSVYQTYGCKICPTSPVTMDRYWHVGHVTTRAKKVSERSRPKTGHQNRVQRSSISEIIGPETARRLRDML